MITRLVVAFLIAALALSAGARAQTTNGAAIASSTAGNVIKILPMPSGQLMFGQGSLADPVAHTMSGDCTLTAGGAITCPNTNGTPFGTAATVNIGAAGATVPVLNAANTFSALQTFTAHVAAGPTSPVLSACGTSPAILGDDKVGLVTMGTGSPTGCVITFASPYVGTPLCVVTWQGTPLPSQSYVIANTAITLTQTGTSSNKANYHCIAQNGG